jgi:hypothetical protein
MAKMRACCIHGLFAIGCAGPDSFRADNEPAFKTADLMNSICAERGRDWAEQEQMMGDIKAAFDAGKR